MTNADAIRAVLGKVGTGITINDVTVMAYSAGLGRGFGGVEISNRKNPDEVIAIPMPDLGDVVTILSAMLEG